MAVDFAGKPGFAASVVSGLMVFLALGCLSPAPPQPRSWVVSAQRKPGAEVQFTRIAKLGSLSVSAPYDKPALAVKRPDGSVAFDAFNVFATSPSLLLRQPLTVVLERDGRFGRVLSAGSSARSDSTIEAVVSDLSLDCREAGRRKACVALTLVVMENREVKSFMDGKGEADASAGDYSAAFSEAFELAVADALAKGV